MLEYEVNIVAVQTVKKGTQSGSVTASRTIRLPFAPVEGTCVECHAWESIGEYAHLTEVRWDMDKRRFNAFARHQDDITDDNDDIVGWMKFVAQQFADEGWEHISGG